MNDTITVIIAAYNVEEWIEKCIKSIIHQSYENLEIIIVNDGSTDRTLEICNCYAEADSRITVITQCNQGLSAARNAALEITTGKFVTFVDGDDFLELTTISKARNIIENNDICTFCLMPVDELGKELEKRTKGEKIVKYLGQQAMKSILSSRCNTGITTCGKLYKVSLFKNNNVLFPVGKYHEDNFTTYKLFYYAKSVVFSSFIGYYYLQRDSSIVHQSFCKKHLDKLEAADECIKFVKQNSPDCIEYAECAALIWNLQVANKILRSGSTYERDLSKIRKTLIRLSSHKNSCISIKYYILIRLFIFDINLYSKILFRIKPNS